MSSPPPLPPAPAAFSPLDADQRHLPIDALRGLAVFGIFVVNILGFKVPLATAFQGQPVHEGLANLNVQLAINVLASGKFVAIFALLFGLGIVLQEQRSRAGGRAFRKFFRRRMGLLLLLGVAHGILLWAGDILAIYAVFGLVSLWFIHWQARSLLKMAGIIFALLIVMLALDGMAAPSFHPETPDPDWAAWVDWWIVTYQTGTLAQIIHARWSEWLLGWQMVPFFEIPYAFSFFLTGMALGKAGILDKPPDWKPRLPRFAAIALPAGYFLSFLYTGITRGWIADNPGSRAASMAGYALGPALVALVYAACFVLLVRSGRLRGLVTRLSEVGRLALTNYLFQSIAANVIFMNWGFGLYGKVPAQAGILIVFGVFALQVVLSHLWLRHFQIGPLEWLWRAASYGTRPAFRREIPLRH